MSSVQKLMSTRPSGRDLNWLKESLQCAIVLEHSTIPPYLCALWSIKDPMHEAVNILRGVAIQEMLHLSLVCNLLAGVGGKPKISAKEVVPKYPGPLPCEIKPIPRPDLVVGLGRLTPAMVSDVFMAIEYPEHGPVAEAVPGRPKFHSIGEFYGAIRDCFRDLKPALTTDHQLENNIGKNSRLFKAATVADALLAIEQIVEQGEGTTGTPDAPDFGHELSHYYKFKQLYVGRMYQQVNGAWTLSGPVLQFPEVWPMADVPVGGYPPDPSPPPELATFNGKYAATLGGLQAAWDKGGQGGEDELDAAIALMAELREPAKALMQNRPLPGGGGLTYGPTFQV